MDKDKSRMIFQEFRHELSAGRVRAAEPDASSVTGWRVNTWVKQGILLGFRCGDLVDLSPEGRGPNFFFSDKDTMTAEGKMTTGGGTYDEIRNRLRDVFADAKWIWHAADPLTSLVCRSWRGMNGG